MVRRAGLLLVLAFGGCATWSKHGVSPRAPEKIRVAVLPVQVDVRIKRLQEIRTVAKPPPSAPEEKELIRTEMSAAADAITRDLDGGLGASYFFEVAADSDVRAALAAAGLSASTAALTGAQVEELGKALDVQAVLATRLAGYGAIKKSWLFYLIGSGLVEGLAQGAAAAAVIGNPWAAVGIGAEEAAQETAEWLGGAYLFDAIYSPVILEARLSSVSDGGVLWSGTELASSNHKAVKALAKADRAKKELRLRLTAQKAAAALVKAINRKAWSNLKNAR